MLAPAMNPDASKLILMNFPCETRTLARLNSDLISAECNLLPYFYY